MKPICSLVAILLGMVLTSSAATLDDLKNAVDTGMSQLGEAATLILSSKRADSAPVMANAAATAAQVVSISNDPELGSALGKRARVVRLKAQAFNTKVLRAKAVTSNSRVSSAAALASVKAARAGGTLLANTLGKSILTSSSRTAGFHHPNDRIVFHIRKADGSPCDETPQVTIQNAYGADAVSPASLTTGPGWFSVNMGSARGSARISAVACGVTGGYLLYNYGPRTLTSAPGNLPLGTYVLEFGASGQVNLPLQIVSTLRNDNAALFARGLNLAFQTIRNSYVGSTPGCSVEIRITPFDTSAQTFTASYFITCCSDGVCATQNVFFRVRRL